MADESGFENVAYFIGGGAEHSPELMRLIPFALSGDAEGIITPGDLKVSALDVPADRVRMAPGSAILQNRHVANAQESYLVRAPNWSYIDVPETGSASGRTDLIGVRVQDPQYEGWPDPPSEEAARNWQYVVPFRIPNVDPAIRHFDELNLGYAAYACALVTLPPSTGTVLDSYITPLRELALPHSDRFLDAQQYSGNGNIDTTSAGGFVDWPGYAPDVRVPRWATDFRMVTTLGNVRQFAQATSGRIMALLGDIGGASPTFDFEAADAGPGGRAVTIVASNGGDCRAIAGTTVKARTRGLITAGGLFVTNGTHHVFDIQFYQRTV